MHLRKVLLALCAALFALAAANSASADQEPRGLQSGALQLDPSLAPENTSAPPGGAEPAKRNRRVIRNGAYLLYFYEHDPADHETFFHVLGTYWYRDKPDWQLHLVAPIGAYWYWKDDSEAYGLVSPLAWHIRGDEASYTGAWLYHAYDSPETRFHTLFPLYWHHYDKLEDDDLHVLGPLIYRSRPERWDVAVLPLLWMASGRHESEFWSPAFFRVRDDRKDETLAGVPPALLFWKSTEDSTTVVQFPLFVEHREPDFVLRMATPLALGVETEDEKFSWLLPLFVGYEGNHTDFRFFLPFLWARSDDKHSDDHFRMLGPIYSWRNGERHRRGIFPLIGFDSDPANGEESTFIAPLYFAKDGPNEHHAWLLPALYGHSRWGKDEELRIVGPWYRATEGQRVWTGLAPIVHLHADPERDTETSLVAPLYLAHDTELTQTRLLAPFLYYRHTDQAADTNTVVAGPGYYKRDGREEDYGLAPFFFYGHDPDKREAYTLIPGLYFHSESEEHFTEWIGPAFRRYDQRGKTYGLAPLALYNEAEDGTQTVAAVPGIYWSHGPDRRRALLGPLWSFRDKDFDSDGLLPLAMRYREKDGDGFVWAPGYLDIVEMSGGEEDWRFTWLLNGFRYHDANGTSTSMVAPLFLESSNARTTESWALAAPWIYTSANERKNERWIFAPPFFYDREEDETDWVLFPLAFGHDDAESSYWLAGPLAFGWEEKRRGGGRALVGPLVFGRFTRGDPESGPYRDVGWFGPFFWNDSDHSHFRMLAPLLVDWADHELGQEFYAFFPFRFHWAANTETESGWSRRELDAWVPFYAEYNESGPDGTTTLRTFGPLFGYTGDRGHGFGAFPLVWHDRTPTSGHDVLFPLFWHFYDDEAETETTVAGPAYALREPNRERYGLAPLYFHDKRTGSQGEDGWDALFPLFWRGYTPDSTTLVTPAGYYTRTGEESSGLLLNYWFHRGERRATDLLFPLFYRHDGPSTKMRWIAPTWFSRETAVSKTTLLAPLYLRTEDKVRESSTTVALPYLGWQSRSETFHSVLPLYMQWDSLRDGSQFVLAGPVWYSGGPDDRGGYDTGIFPLLWWGADDDATDDRYFLGFPIVWHSLDNAGTDAEESWTVVGPTWHHKDPGGWSAGVFPIAFAQRDRDEDAFRAMLFPAYHSQVRDEATTIVGPLYHTASETRASAGVFPVAHWETDDEADHTRSWLFPVAYYDRDGDDHAIIAGPAFHVKEGDDRDWGVAPIIWRWERDKRAGSAVLPAYWYEGREDGHTFISPLAYSWRQGDEWKRWALLYGAAGNRESSSHALVPLFFSRRRSDGSGLDIALPGYVRYKRPGDRGGATVLFPLYWNFYDRARGSDATVLFPLYWDFETPKRRLQVIGPWFKSQRQDVDRVTHGLIPLYYYSRDPYGYTFNVLGGMVGVDHTRETNSSDYQLLWIPF